MVFQVIVAYLKEDKSLNVDLMRAKVSVAWVLFTKFSI